MSARQSPESSRLVTPRTSVDSVSTLRSVSSTAPTGSSRSLRGTPTSSTAAAARRNALREFYSIGQDRYRAGVAQSDIDRPDFQPEVWLDRFVRENTLKEVLAKENTLMHEIRTLDGEGKALVYDNYSKLISATETIKSMRGNMDPLQPTTSALEPAVAHIAEVSTTLIATLSERRRKLAADEHEDAKVEISKEVMELVRALVDAPNKIKDMVDKGEREKAQKYWQTLELAVKKLNRVKGISKIIEQCEKALKEEEEEKEEEKEEGKEREEEKEKGDLK